VGALMGLAGTSDIADAALVSVAASRTAEIVASDRTDIRRLVSKSRQPLRVVDL
jgi:hypothetical protein